MKTIYLALLSLLVVAGCAKSTAVENLTASNTPKNTIPDVSYTDPENATTDGEQNQEAVTTQILLFNGIGTSVSDWKNLELIIKTMGLSYRLVNTAALNVMSVPTLETFGLILIPGGNSNTINTALVKSAKIKVRQAVRDGGVSFLGICAGAFAAVGTDSLTNTTAYYGFGVAQGDYLTYYYPNGDSSLLAAVPKVSFADGTERYLMWYNGPGTPEWPRGVVARYPGGRPAISQTWTGSGFVIVSGPHPEAPPSWQYDSGIDPDGLDYDIAKKLISAALFRKPLAAY